MKAKLSVVATVTGLAIALAACATPTSGAGGGEAGPQQGRAANLQQVYAQLQGLQGQARANKLEELAKAEGDSLMWYTSMNVEDSNPMAEAFTETYGIDVEIYRASSSDVQERVLEESKANYSGGADLVASNGPEMQILHHERLLQPLKTPVRESIYKTARYDTWLGIYLNTFVAAWNTDALGESEHPQTWEDVLTNYRGRLAMELEDWDWFATLTKEYFTDEKGMTQAETVQMFRQAAAGSTVVDGHTTMAELMTAGEFDVAASPYMHEILQLKNEGAPVEFADPTPVEPIVVRPNGIGIHRDTDAPASSLLFLEYALTKGQQHIADIHRTPANTDYGRIPPQYEAVSIDLDQLLAERQKWEDIYETVVRESNKDVIEGD